MPFWFPWKGHCVPLCHIWWTASQVTEQLGGSLNAFSSVVEHANDMRVWPLPSESSTEHFLWNSSQLRIKFVLLRKLYLSDSESGLAWSWSRSTAGAEIITVDWAGSNGWEVQAFRFVSQAQFPGAWPKQCPSGAGHFLHLFPWKLPGGKQVIEGCLIGQLSRWLLRLFLSADNTSAL